MAGCVRPRCRRVGARRKFNHCEATNPSKAADDSEEHKSLKAQVTQLREDYRTLFDCLCTAGLVTPQALEAQRRARLHVTHLRGFCSQAALMKAVTLAAGLQAMGRLSATFSVLSATLKAVFPCSELPCTPRTQRRLASSNLGLVAAEEQPRSTFTLRFLVWPFASNGSSTVAKSTSLDETAQLDKFSAETGACTTASTRQASEAPAEKVDIVAVKMPHIPEALDDEKWEGGPAASLLGQRHVRATPSENFAKTSSQTSQYFFGRFFASSEPSTTADAPAKNPFGRPLETLADSCETVDAKSVKESSAAAPERSEPQRHMGSTRFLGSLLGYGTRSEVQSPAARSMVELLEVMRGLGLAAGVTASRNLSQVCRSSAEGLCPYLPELSLAAPFLYVCGGSCGIAVDSAERFSVQTGLWESLPSMLIPRRACTAASLGGKFYVMGGVDVPRFNGSIYSDSLQQPWVFEDRHRPECFDPTTLRWELLPAMRRPYTHAAATSAGGLLYVFGGLSFGSVLDQAQRFDPARHQWEDLEPMPTPRFECAAAQAKGLIYVLGGANPCGEPLAVAECYSPRTGQWRSLPRMMQPRYGCGAAAMRGKVYVFGGHGIWEDLSSTESFDPEANVWSPLEPMPCRRNHCSAAAACGKIFIFGGHSNGEDIITVDSLDPVVGIWEVAALMARPRSHCMSVAVQP
mmetsp:Transcript_83110/g.193061  ORF Transcript_83110/g.193061 Transcript_83110/m.193061 type:complete len:690 (+) Transcript_83110:73-2142(+)|eukprot:CAMPEP_0171060614 /NCGR_PEP_ID=MMETSP0766_2-20121228/3942_1 /TAXON_ID=439317 /ORGANISM="Gambierdiscus australes, Strain CAWD 149" /LENGTH=689 /DNA_ID=CAMNT_0011516213 /DNA_START=71 /DNA_END=2140 /DNA_ORIENTATION=-